MPSASTNTSSSAASPRPPAGCAAATDRGRHHRFPSSGAHTMLSRPVRAMAKQQFLLPIVTQLVGSAPRFFGITAPQDSEGAIKTKRQTRKIAERDRKSVGWGKSVAVRVERGARRIMKKKKQQKIEKIS